MLRYGDRAPKSIPARLFGLFWMFGGIILMSVFTAVLTTALSADTQQDFVVKGSKVQVELLCRILKRLNIGI